VTMTDPTTLWIKEAPGMKTIDALANAAWFPHRLPARSHSSLRNRIMAEVSKIAQDNPGVKKKLITKRNPQVNATARPGHQTAGNMIWKCSVQENPCTDEGDDPSEPYLSNIKGSLEKSCILRHNSSI
jgi:hypothetical protein